MSKPRYAWRASAETTEMGASAAHAAATAVLPTPVGPTIAGTSGGCATLLRTPHSAPPESAFQLRTRQLYHRGPAVHIVGRQRRAQQSDHELPHFLHLQPLARLHGGATPQRPGKPLQPVGEGAR